MVRLSDFDIVILDIGGILFRDDLVESMYVGEVYRVLAEMDPAITPARLCASRERLIRCGNTDWLETVSLRLLGSARWASTKARSWDVVLDAWDRLAVPINGAICAVRQLAGQTRLAILANQPRNILGTLEKLGLSQLFEFIAIDAMLPYSKPDPRIYEWALVQARTLGERALMVGDRIDNDIYPAQLVGMRTAWIITDLPFSRFDGMSLEWQEAYFGSLSRVGNHNRHEFRAELRGVQPDLRAESLPSLLSI